MDMWEPYVQSTRAHLPGADDKIVFDKFHVVKHLHDAVDKVRRGEHRALRRGGDEAHGLQVPVVAAARTHDGGPTRGLPALQTCRLAGPGPSRSV
jgi:transposase